MCGRLGDCLNCLITHKIVVRVGCSMVAIVILTCIEMY
jgi:hypothetical protein